MPAGWEGRGLQKTFTVSKRVFPKDRMSLRASRWLAVAASERKRGVVHCAAWPPDPQKPFVFLRKTSIFAKSLFCIQRWLGSCLETSCGRLGATPTRPGRVTPLIWWPPMRRRYEESHTDRGWQNETNRSQRVIPKDRFGCSGSAEGCFPRIA